MPSSIRNEIPGTVKSLTKSEILSEVIIDTAVGEIVSVITTRSVEALDLKPGDTVTAQVKATNLSLCKCSCGNH